MPSRVFIDTNVLLYLVSFDPRATRKQAVAAHLLEREDCALSVQVLNEFVHQACRTSRPSRLSVDEAWTMVASWRRYPVQDLNLAVLDQARSIQMRTLYSVWDSLIVAAAIAQGCGTLYTEDMQDGRVIDGLRIVNPFRE